jgi:RNA polymerase sigma-70 factor, ECF subfamily
VTVSQAQAHAPVQDPVHGGSPDDEGREAHVLAALAGDLDSGFTALFCAYRRVVFSTAYRVSGTKADAEDLTAEAFMRAYRALRGYGPDRIAGLRVRPWLLTILLNLWRNSQRSAARHPAEPFGALPETASPGESVEQAASRRETGRELAALLLELPARQRVAVVLRHVSDLPVTEIAAILGQPEGTVKSHISRGLRRLRELGSKLHPAPDEAHDDGS